MFAPLFFLLAAPRIASAAPFDFPTPAPSTAPISVIYPTEGLNLPTLEHEFVIGSVSDSGGRLTINNQPVPIYKDGAFVSWLPVSTGSFTFHCQLLTSATTFTYDRHVVITPPPQPLPLNPPAIASSSLSPGENEVLRPGDWLVARMQATPRQKAEFRVPTAGWLPMSDPSGEGFYTGAYQVRPGDHAPPFAVRFRIGGFWSGASARSPGTVSFTEAPPRIAVATDSEDVIVKTGPDEGNVFSVLKGMPFVIVGRKGLWDKIRLSPDQDGWLERVHLQTLPEGTPPPSAELSAISTRPSAQGTSVLFSLDARVPFQVEEADDLRSLTLKFYYTHSHNNWIIYRPDDAMVSSISFRQAASDVTEARINLKRSAILWGYHAGYEGAYVRIDLRQAPLMAATPRSPLSGLRVFLDPGHMPSAPGAIGPLGTREMDVNFAIAQEAAALLKRQGAVPLISRPNDQD
ncbi:MAG: N-acetylmuramoyl-L-alanine amidase, partial [Elusimicrobia bacterium]|nr:N-acetylmuramoyl-L-alanine amidase [Elusimicrobiota bacterium]